MEWFMLYKIKNNDFRLSSHEIGTATIDIIGVLCKKAFFQKKRKFILTNLTRVNVDVWEKIWHLTILLHLADVGYLIFSRI